MTTKKELYGLARTFAKAVEGYSEVNPALEQEFADALTPAEIFALFCVNLDEDPNGNPVLADEVDDENYLAVAEIYASVAQRTGKSGEIKQFVPAAARAEDVRKALAREAPAFAKLCS